MTVTTNEYGVVKLEADEGKAICRVDESGPTTVTTLYLAKTESAADYKDCAYGVPVPPRTFSKYKLVLKLMELDLWNGVKAWIEATPGAYDLYLAAEDISEDEPLLAQGIAALKQELGIADEQIAAILDAAAI